MKEIPPYVSVTVRRSRLPSRPIPAERPFISRLFPVSTTKKAALHGAAFRLFLLSCPYIHAETPSSSPPSRQRRGQATLPEQKFFRGWGCGGRGSFYQKTSLPPQLSQKTSSPPGTQPRSQWPGWTSRHVPLLSSSGQGRISLRCSKRGSGTGMAESRARV